MFTVSGRLAVFRNEDDVELAGFAMGPERPSSGLGVLYLHGKGGNFYTGPGRFLSIGLADKDCLHLSMNMRCHDVGYTRYDMESPDISVGGAVVDGGAWERTAEGWKDIDAGIAYLQEQGCTRVVLAGHSSGGLYTGVYEDRRGIIAGRVFLSPLMTSRTAFQVWLTPRPSATKRGPGRRRWSSRGTASAYCHCRRGTTQSRPDRCWSGSRSPTTTSTKGCAAGRPRCWRYGADSRVGWPNGNAPSGR